MTALGKRHRPSAKGITTLAAGTEAKDGKAAAEASPLDYLLSVMRDPAVDPERRDEMAKLALPYVHAKPSAAEQSAKDAEPGDAASLSAIDIARRIAFTLTKAALTPSSQDERKSPEAQAARQPLGALGSR